MGKEQTLQQTMLRKLDTCIEKDKVEHSCLIPIQKLTQN